MAKCDAQFVEGETHARLYRSQGKVEAGSDCAVRVVLEEGKLQQGRLFLGQCRDRLV